MKEGTIDDLLESVASRNGKSINALDFPLPELPHPPLAMSSDMVAWNEILNDSQPQFPTPATRWGLAATAGAHHRMHTDANSFSTYIQVKTGMKLWIVACPKGSDFANFADFLNIIHFHDSDGLDNPDLSDYKDQYRLEAMLLLPGSQLYMI